MTKKIKIQIKNYLGSVIFEYSSVDNTIKKTINEANLRRANLHGADLHGADLHGANLREADLREADLREADLREADLRGADLRGANLRGADLREANLRGANLRGAKGVSKIHQSDLTILRYQKGKIRAFKYLNRENVSPYQEMKYEIGKSYSEKKFNSDEKDCCGEGLNIATLEWCIKDTNCNLDDFIYVEVEFDVKDIVAIPYFSDGKFRVKKLKVIRKVTKKELQKAMENI